MAEQCNGALSCTRRSCDNCFPLEARLMPTEAQLNAAYNPLIFEPAPIGHNGGPPIEKWSPDEVDALGIEKGFLPEAYWPDEAIGEDEAIINPKEIAGAKKPAIWQVMPRWVILLAGRVMSVGAAKYGVFNYRDSNVSAMTYVDAIERHMQLWQDGENDDPETGVSHLAHVIAGCAILLDAQANGTLGDDRQKTGMARKTLNMLEGLLTSHPLPAPQY
jgi:hypothetical protein